MRSYRRMRRPWRHRLDRAHGGDGACGRWHPVDRRHSPVVQTCRPDQMEPRLDLVVTRHLVRVIADRRVTTTLAMAVRRMPAHPATERQRRPSIAVTGAIDLEGSALRRKTHVVPPKWSTRRAMSSLK